MIASGQFSDVAVAKPNLTELLDVMNVTIALYRRINLGEVMMVDKLERPHRVRITVQAGEHVPIQGGSSAGRFSPLTTPRSWTRRSRTGCTGLRRRASPGWRCSAMS